MTKTNKTTPETTSYSSYHGNILSDDLEVAVGVDDSLTTSPKEQKRVFMCLFITNIKTMLLSRKSLFAVVALFLLMATFDVAIKTTYSAKISSSVNFLIGSDYMSSDYPAPGSCEVDGCGKADFLPTEDCEWGDATYPKDKGDQQGQKPGCTFCYSSEKDSEDSFRPTITTRHRVGFHTYPTRVGDVLSGVCKFKLPIGAECTTWRFGYFRRYGNTPRIGKEGSDERCMTNNCAPNSQYSKYYCKA